VLVAILDVIQLFQCEVACSAHQSAQRERAVTSTSLLDASCTDTIGCAYDRAACNIQAGASHSLPASPLNSSRNLDEQFRASWGLLLLCGVLGPPVTDMTPFTAAAMLTPLISSPVLIVGHSVCQSRSPSLPAQQWQGQHSSCAAVC
jgi:hypothetical protein